ncbi:hypothetical protein TVAG_245860 [Trichomonas vaginalis G3]|uniref:Uncharacterized protein n=1 Tax=Trichomonas vaginalis (strain ATCC PRA-98 / G3) TaxID=412133 RepID=A2E4P4_TRIV3|nr:hypothetical protein TVAGG3_0862440 [Trichomonas vaginalis G3]EAY12354.1 hypothetical protein TVAG_245860 [Trichomonas vaginalis G3]KAI5500772.1 hypothetical protein TVAGG3_0862440 [Trichomonas vaginalis G3]|eukprot:XP_001324577.1 hypothetical protein [Trichomonas vaginalis G3]
MKKAAPKRDAKVADTMIKNGVPNHSKCLFLALIALAAKEEHSEVLKSNLKIENKETHKIAAKLVYDYLKRINARITLQLVQTDGDLHYFSTANKQSIECLELLPNKPPIQKLIRMRYAQVRKIESDDETHGWFDIESELSNTITMEPNSGSTFDIDTLAYRERDIDAEPVFANESRRIHPAQNFTIPESVQAANYAKDKKSFKSKMSARSIRDALSQPVQLVGDKNQTTVSYEDSSSSGRIVPSVGSGRRGRRSENNK